MMRRFMATTLVHPETATARGGYPWLPVAAIGLAVVAFEALAATRYGYHRDELYFMAAGRRPAWGYVDQPPLTPLLARLAGNSLLGLKLLAAVAGAAVIAMGAAIARELGGGRRAQVATALALATSTVFVVVRHLFSTSAFDVVAWTALLLLTARLLRGADRRLWLAVGAVAGVGLLNKHLVLVLGVGLVGGLLVGRRTDALRTPWLWAGGMVALALAAPNIAWQVANDWPTAEMTALLAEEHGGVEGVAELVLGQFLVVNPFLAPLWVAGLVWLLRSPRARPFRPLGWAALLVFATFVLTGGQVYYPAGLYPALFAAGAVAVEPLLVRRPALVAGVALTGLLPLVAVVPVLPAAGLNREPLASVVGALGEHQVESLGWPELVSAVARVREGLPAAERDGLVVLTGNYGEAGAIERFGPALGLPTPISGHNAYGMWGPGDAGDGATIAVGLGAADLSRVFRDCRPAARITNRAGVANEEAGLPITLCRGLRGTWAEHWPQLVHLG